MHKAVLPALLLPALLLGACAQAPLPAVTAAPATTPAASVAPSAAPANPAPQPTPEFFLTQADAMRQPRVVVHKAARVLEVYDGVRLMARIPIALGFAPVGHKQREGDGRTPEGGYYACVRNEKSRYHLSIGLSYPNAEDARLGLAGRAITQEQYDQIVDATSRGARPPWNTPLGGEIMLHGGGTDGDWTAGCIAMETADIDYLWQHIPLGTPVEIIAG